MLDIYGGVPGGSQHPAYRVTHNFLPLVIFRALRHRILCLGLRQLSLEVAHLSLIFRRVQGREMFDEPWGWSDAQ
jgi:hypothetical protein